jgi:hypothetical protein
LTRIIVNLHLFAGIIKLDLHPSSKVNFTWMWLDRFPAIKILRRKQINNTIRKTLCSKKYYFIVNGRFNNEQHKKVVEQDLWAPQEKTGLRDMRRFSYVRLRNLPLARRQSSVVHVQEGEVCFHWTKLKVHVSDKHKK